MIKTGNETKPPQLNHPYHRCGSQQMFAVRTSCTAGYTSSLPRIFAVVPPPGPGGTRVGKSFRPLTRETVEESGVLHPIEEIEDFGVVVAGLGLRLTDTIDPGELHPLPVPTGAGWQRLCSASGALGYQRMEESRKRAFEGRSPVPCILCILYTVTKSGPE